MNEQLAAAEPASLDRARIEHLTDLLRRARSEIAAAVVGQGAVVDQLLLALIAGGHVLLEGAPGVGKTLIVRTLGQVTGLDFARVQFTPDLMPADITGGMTLVPDADGRTRLGFQKGPIFTQILLADEINRATPKTQSALLEAMQEGTVTAGGHTTPLPEPFFVLATQNPIEMEGTYRLPEAQIDRFLLKAEVNYPQEEELDAILDLTTGYEPRVPRQVLTQEDLLLAQRLVRMVPMASHLRRAVARFSVATQPQIPTSPEPVRRYLRFGLSPRGAQAMVLSAKAHALVAGRYNVAFDDLEAVLAPVLRHRFQLNYEGEAAGVEPLGLLAQMFAEVKRGVT
ncbi:AAA family ATPase [Roseitranquillus sediminis]|uniref:AAA family ATPase n=1 Tax=Roseitranquillus sediminis TaxID=2809051 RepID=UPI001D0C3A37|nr:MoxR family ATPase [Roseitranquillus sediminis]MBM9594486.1 MoxR family ATPase [Roseitranquillus sediminis]